MEKINESWEIKRSLVVKAEEETDMRFGHRPEERPIVLEASERPQMDLTDGVGMLPGNPDATIPELPQAVDASICVSIPDAH